MIQTLVLLDDRNVSDVWQVLAPQPQVWCPGNSKPQRLLVKPLLPPLCKHGALRRPTWQRRWLPPTLQTRHSAADVRSNAQKLINAL